MGQFEKYLGKKLDGRYELREIIGLGGMAVVYQAYDLKEERMVAVKLLKEEYLANDEFRRRFKTEYKAISVLSHPNIVKIYDVCLGDRLQYIVMELVDGITLKEYIEQQKVLGRRESLHFLSQLLSALAHAHDKGIIHRDIKPQNILLTSNGCIKVTDFGIARFSRATSDTMTDKAIGSVHYISPEQAKGDNVDGRADLYSAGVILYEMLTGKLPFEAETAVKIVLMQMNEQPVPPCEVNPAIPTGLGEIILKAMQKEPKFRYQSAAQMQAAIDDFRHNPDIVFHYSYVDEADKTKFLDALTSAGDVSKRKNKKNRSRNAVKEHAAKAKKAKKQPSDAPKAYHSRWLQILFGITAAVVLATGLFVGVAVLLKTPIFTPATETVDLPNFVGMNYYDLMNDERYADFHIEYDASNYNDDHAKDIIYEQSPTPPKRVLAGSKITVKVSLGPRLIPLPDLTGREKTAAIAAVNELGLFPKVVERYSADTPPGYVISTDPPQLTEVSLGSTVILYVGITSDTKAVEVPYAVVGTTVADARNILLGSGFALGGELYTDSDQPEGTVIGTSPSPGTMVSAGEMITLIVSNGRWYVDTTQYMQILLYDLPVRSFEYLAEVYRDGDEEPIYTTVMSPDKEGSMAFNVKVETGTVTYRVKVNDQQLRIFTVNFDNMTYRNKGTDYAVDLVPGYVTSAHQQAASSQQAQNSQPTSSGAPSSEPESVPQETSSQEDPID
ncbi:MAG: Stk1 family PASTA domain-containing Ser/Thr kinase [Clostridia bacterium]|nr:Stk1 family PASTA domain-containing Ser/Thr kinase [Clostridia bacterium]